MFRTEEEWINLYRERKALWIHDGNPKRPHVLLTSDKHSSGFFNSKLVIAEHDHLRWQAVGDLLDTFLFRGFDFFDEVDRVVGPATGATLLAVSLALAISMRHPPLCEWASPEKEGEGADKKLMFKDDRRVLPGERVLLCEDVLTTGGTTDLATQVVSDAGGIVLPWVAVIVNRSGLTDVGGKEIVALIDRPMPTWEPGKGKCLLCDLGSEAIRPKGPEEWALLNAEY